jgi:hypothetical protein
MSARIRVGRAPRLLALALGAWAALLVGPSVSPAAAQETVAASCSPPTNTIAAGTGGDERFAQTFSPSLSGPLTRVEIDVVQAGTPGAYVVQLMGVDSGTGLPNNTVLASTTVPDSMPDQEYLLSATFSPAASVVAGQSYALIITRPGSDTLKTGIRFDCPGEFFYSPAGTSDWLVDAPNEDFVFTAFVIPPAPPGARGQRAAALKRCKKKHKRALNKKTASHTLTPQVKKQINKKFKKCKKKANRLPV